MDDKTFLEFLYEEVPNNLNIHKYLIVTRNKLREYREAYNAFKKSSGKT